MSPSQDSEAEPASDGALLPSIRSTRFGRFDMDLLPASAALTAFVITVSSDPGIRFDLERWSLAIDCCPNEPSAMSNWWCRVYEFPNSN